MVENKHPALAFLAAGLLQLACQSPPSAPPPPEVTAAVQSVARDAATSATVADRYDLERDEHRGGHTLSRHVGRSDADLRERLRREREISAASTYTDRAIAERAVAQALAKNRARVDQWLAREGPRPNLALDYHAAGGGLSDAGRAALQNYIRRPENRAAVLAAKRAEARTAC